MIDPSARPPVSAMPSGRAAFTFTYSLNWRYSMNQTLGLIGSGNIGSALARFAVAAGVNVVLSNSRGPETLAELVAELGEQARAATPTEAARAGDLVVATIPLAAYKQLPVAALAGETVIDTIVY